MSLFELPYETLLMMIEGTDLAAVRRRRYQRSSVSPA